MNAPVTGDPAVVPETHEATPVRNVPLTLLAVFATIALLYWARTFFIPLVLGLILSYALAPVVDRLERLRVPRSIAAAVLLLAIVAGLGAAAVSLREEATGLIESLPEAIEKIQAVARREGVGPVETIERVQQAAADIERAAAAEDPVKLPRGVTRVQVEEAPLKLRDYIVTTVVGGITAASVVLIVLFLAFFLLASGKDFRRKWVQLSGPALSSRRITVQVLDEIAAQVQLYLGVQALTSVIVGVASGLAFWAVGLENAAIWGITAGVLNLVPYLGAIITTLGTTLVAFLQFGTFGMAFTVGGISLVINGLEGYWLTPWLSGRASRMNAVVIFSGLLFWSWLWGPWGLVLGLPILMVIKVVCDHVERLQPIGEFMGK